MSSSAVMLVFGCAVTLIGFFSKDYNTVIIGNIWMVGSIISQKIDNKKV